MENISITEAANFAKVTREKARYWSKLLELKITKLGRVSYIPAGSEQLIMAMNKSISNGLSPSVAAKEVLSIHALPTTNKPSNIDSNEFKNRINSLEQAVMLLVEQNKMLVKTTETQNKKIEAQNEFIVTSLQIQKQQLKTIQIKLDPPITTKKIEVWQPPKPKQLQLSAFKRLWYEVISPEKLRAN